MDDLVSVIVPIYNMASSIKMCVKALQEQDYPYIEIILVDDGSKDDTYEICKSIEAEDSRIRTIHTENRGSGPARNAGIEAAKGKYAYFPDADDYLEPYAITKMVEGMCDDKYDLVVFGFRNVDQQGKITLEKTYEESDQCANKIRKNYKDYMGYTSKWGIQGAPWNKFFNLEKIKGNGIEYPALRRHQDEGFIGRYMCHVKRVHFLPYVLYTYYTNDLKKEWQKYPVDYIDAVIGLKNVRKETIYTWNEKDTATHEMLANEYICNVIKALELSFSPKMKLDGQKRKRWIANAIKKSGIKDVMIPGVTGSYQRLALKLIQRDSLAMLYYYFLIKVKIEGTKVYSSVRKTK